MLDGFRQPAQLVIGQRQVHAHAGVVRQLFERQIVFGDGIGELAVADQGRAQVGADFGGVRIGLQELAVQADGGAQIAGLERGVGVAQGIRGHAVAGGGQRQREQQNHGGESHPEEIIAWGAFRAGLAGNRFLTVAAR